MTLPADLNALLDDLRPAAARAASQARRRHRTLVVLTTVLVVGLCAGVAVAAIKVLGGPAPKSVQTNLHQAAHFIFAGHPGLVAQTAVVVAEAPDATLYGVSDRSGNYCAELVGATKGFLFAFSCNISRMAVTSQMLGGEQGTDVEYVATDDGVEPPVVEFGRLPTGTVSARAVYDNGVIEPISLGLNHFYLYEPSPQNQTLARRLPMTLQFLDRGGRPVWSVYVQPPQPLRTEGSGPDRISGHVLIKGAAKVKLQLGMISNKRAAMIYVPIRSDGSFTWSAPRNSPEVFTLSVVDGQGQALSTDVQPLPEAVWRAWLADATKRP